MKKFRTKITLLLAGVAFLLSIIISVSSLLSLSQLKTSAYELHEEAIEAKHESALRYQAEIGTAILKNNFFREQRGEVTLEEAKENAIREMHQTVYAGNASFILLGKDGTLLNYRQNPDLVGTDVTSYQSSDGQQIFKEIMDGVSSGSSLGFYLEVPAEFSASQGGQPEEALLYAVSFNEFDWIIATYEMTNSKATSLENFSLKMQDLTNSIVYYQLIISAVFLVVVIIASYIIGGRIAQHIVRVSKAAKELSEGNLTISNLKVHGKDELGQLANSFNESVKGIHDIVLGAKGVATDVYEQTEIVDGSMHGLSIGTEQISMTIEEIASGVSKQAESSDNIRQKSENVMDFIVRINEEIAESGRITEKTKDVVVQGKDTIEVQKVKMDENKKATDKTVKSITALSEISNEISSIVNVIEGISSQTTLLALNASIEAARAGEAGKGFSVVADEIRKLAEETVNSTSKITQIIANVNVAVSESIASMDVASDAVSEQEKALDLTRDAFERIIESVNESYQKSVNVKQSTEELTNQFEVINHEIVEIASISEESSAAVEEVSATTQQQAEGFRKVNEVTNELNKVAKELIEAMSRFSV